MRKIKNGTKIRLEIDFDVDTKFIAITPAFNINRHGKLFTFEIEWLIFAMYCKLSTWDFKNPFKKRKHKKNAKKSN